MDSLLEQDSARYAGGGKDVPLFQRYFRKYQQSTGILRQLYRFLYKISASKRFIEIPRDTQIMGGLYFNHAHSITINANAKIGMNCNIHKGVTIGQENRGKRKGAPVIGNDVWIGVNSTLVGNILIGDDVLIAPNTYVNCDIPSHSIVFGNPCVIKSSSYATEGYVNRKVVEKQIEDR